MRNPRYRFTFAYVARNGDKMMFGKTEESIVTRSDMETMLKVLSPLRCMEWLERIGELGRNSFVVFEMDGMETENGINIPLKKLLRIQRN